MINTAAMNAFPWQDLRNLAGASISRMQNILEHKT